MAVKEEGHIVKLKNRVPVGIIAAGGAVATMLVPASPASAGSTNTIANVGLPSGGSLSTTTVGTGRHVSRVDYTRVAGQICDYAGGWNGNSVNNGPKEGWGDVHAGCKFGSAGDTVAVNKDFVNKTWFRGRWKEQGEIAPGRTSHCIELNWWDTCS